MVKVCSYFGQIKQLLILTDNIMVWLNPFQMKIRSEKQIAMVLGLSRNQIKSLLDKGEIELVMELPQSVSFSISHCLFSMVT